MNIEFKKANMNEIGGGLLVLLAFLLFLGATGIYGAFNTFLQSSVTAKTFLFDLSLITTSGISSFLLLKKNKYFPVVTISMMILYVVYIGTISGYLPSMLLFCSGHFASIMYLLKSERVKNIYGKFKLNI